MKEKIKSFEKYKNEAVLFMIMLFVFLVRFPLRDNVIHIVYGETLLTNSSSRFGLVKHLENFDNSLYWICVVLALLVFAVYFILICKFIGTQNGKWKDRAIYICAIFSVVPLSIFSVISSDNFSVVMLVGVLVAGLCVLLCENQKTVVLIPVLTLLAAIISPVCVCIIFPIIFYPLRFEVKNSRKQTFHKTAYVLCQIEYTVCVLMIAFAFFSAPYFVKEYLIPTLVTVLICIPVMTPVFVIFKGYDKKIILLISLLSIPVLMSSTDMRISLICIVSSMFLSVIYLLKKENQSLKNETDKLFKWFDRHIFLSCCYVIYCCVLSASSFGAVGGIAENLLRYIVL